MQTNGGMFMNESILYDRSTTLPGNRDHFPRSRVDKLLSEAVRSPLVIVTAGAGWGKTQAVSSYLRNTDIEFTWLKLSKLDNFVTRFWESFAHAVGMRDPALGAQLRASEFPQSEALFYNFLHMFAGSASDTGKLVLVFDDFHLITERSVIRFVENLLWARLKNLVVILIGRTSPVLELQGLYTDKLAFHINEDDLRFTKQETADYFEKQGVELSSRAFEVIYTQTEGWIAAIYLIGLSSKKSGDVTQDAYTMAKRQIHALIDSEIFSGYSDALQRRLIELSLFENIPVDVLMEYSTDGFNLMEKIEKTNLFVRFNPATRTYDIHNLFLDFLTKKQVNLTEAELSAAHLKTANWYDANGDKLNALSHYRACENQEKIWDIIRCYDLMLPIDLANRFLELIDGFPEEFIKKNPLILVVNANLLLYKGEIAASMRELQMVVNTYEALPPTADNLSVAGEAYLFMGMVSMLSFDYQFVEYYKKADAYLPGGSTLIDRKLGFSRGNFMMLVNNPAQGEFQRFVDAIMEAMPYGVKAMNGAGYGVKYVTKAEAAYYMCDMKEAEDCCYKAISQAKTNGQLATVCAACSILTRIYIGTGNYAKAAACMEELDAETEDPDHIMLTEHYIVTRDIMMGWYYTRLGIHERVPDWILKEENRGLSPNALGREDFIRANYLLETGKYYELSALLERLEAFYGVNGVLLARIEIQIYKSVLANKTGNLSQSVSALRNAYDLAIGNGLFMQFIELGKYMRAVIYNARNSKDNTIPDIWLDEIDTKAKTHAKHISNVRAHYRKSAGADVNIDDIITKREKAILGYLCQGMSGREIADSLYISVNTVKKALGTVYNKLGASNKADAIRIALQLGLHE